MKNFFKKALYRSFQPEEEFLKKIKEILSEKKNKKILLFLFDGGFWELFALRCFLSEVDPRRFQFQESIGFHRLLVEGVSGFIKNFLKYPFSNEKRKQKSRYLDEFATHSVLLVNIVSDEDVFYDPQADLELEEIEDSLQKAQDVEALPLSFVWRRSSEKVKINENVSVYGRFKKVFLSPIKFFWELFFGTAYRPTAFRKALVLLRGYSSSAVILGESFSSEGMSLRNLKRKALQSIQHEKSVILGASYKMSTSFADEVLYRPEFTRFLQGQVSKKGKSFFELRKKAKEYFFEIASVYSQSTLELLGWFFNKIFNTIYDGIHFEKKELEKLKELSKNSCIVFVPNHKSYLDFLVLSYLLYDQKMAPPYVAAGINLNFWPVGNFFKRGGAFFIRRSFKDNLLYKEVLGRYLAALINNKESLEFFIEGTRSRIGKLMPPRYGMLNMILESYEKGALRSELNFIPVSIGYDCVTEDAAYQHELEGGAKVKENIFNTFRSSFSTVLKKYGKVHVSFGKEILLSSWADGHGVQVEKKIESDQNRKEAVYKLAFELSNRINKKMPVTAFSLLSLIFSTEKKEVIHKDELFALARQLLPFVEGRGFRAELALRGLPDKALSRALARLLREGMVEKVKAGSFRVLDKKRLSLWYYKNTCIHAFLSPAFKSLTKGDEKKVEILRNLLEFEFFFPEKKEFHKELCDLDCRKVDFFMEKVLRDFLGSLSLCLQFLLTRDQFYLSKKEFIQELLDYSKKRDDFSIEAKNTHSIKTFSKLALKNHWFQLDEKSNFKFTLSDSLSDLEKTRREIDMFVLC